MLVPDNALPLNQMGKATWQDGHCTVVVKRSVYPRCITHEVRHCIEGHFHSPGLSSNTDCDME